MDPSQLPAEPVEKQPGSPRPWITPSFECVPLNEAQNAPGGPYDPGDVFHYASTYS